MAKDAVDAVVDRFDLRARPSSTARVPLRAPARVSRLDLWRDVAGRLPPARLARILARYGEAAWDVLALVREDASLAEPVCPHHDVALAELAHGVRSEMARTAEDLLLRRTRLGYSRCGAAESLPRLSVLLDRN
jgi:glycerol-3-phosphate dehydrogenase